MRSTWPQHQGGGFDWPTKANTFSLSITTEGSSTSGRDPENKHQPFRIGKAIALLGFKTQGNERRKNNRARRNDAIPGMLRLWSMLCIASIMCLMNPCTSSRAQTGTSDKCSDQAPSYMGNSMKIPAHFIVPCRQVRCGVKLVQQIFRRSRYNPLHAARSVLQHLKQARPYATSETSAR